MTPNNSITNMPNTLNHPRKRPQCKKALAILAAVAGLSETRPATAQNTLDESSNWSGYFASAPGGEAFTNVSSTFVVPTLSPSSSGETYSSFWVGFDGATDTTVEQCGVSENISSSGSVTYTAWYEFAPAAEKPVSFSFQAGDTITATATYEGHSSSGYGYNFDLIDETTDATYDMTQYTAKNDARSSADWIAEAPSLGSTIQNLANFGSVTFSNDMAALNNGSAAALGTFSPVENEMLQNVIVALPTSITSTASAFNVTYSPANLTWDNAGALGPSDGSSWDFAGNNNWNSGSASAAYTDGDAVTFNDNNNGNYAVNINSYFLHPASVTVNSSGNYTISGTGDISGTGSLTKSGTGTLTLATSNGYTGGTFVTAGRLLIEPAGTSTSALATGALSITGNGVVQLADNVTAGNTLGTSNVVLTSLAITGNGTLDIGNNHIIIDYTSPATDPIASIAQWIANGFNDLPGPSIISSDIATADSSTGLSYGIGYADGADGIVAGLPSGEIEIMFTLLGDANLDGTVNAEDYTSFSHNVGLNGMYWDDGDFNYDGTVNAEDYTLFAPNIGQSALLAALASPLESASSITNIPEPTTAALLTFTALGILPHRRRRSRRSPG
jgi:autotransporter-associated beta strand protein